MIFFWFLRDLNLRQPIYQSTSCYGHFGRSGFSWENAKELDLNWLDVAQTNPQDGSASSNIDATSIAALSSTTDNEDDATAPPTTVSPTTRARAGNVSHVDKKARIS